MIKRLLQYMRPYRRECALAPAFKLAEALMDLLVPLVVASIINGGVATGDSGAVVSRFALLIGLAALGMGFAFTAQWFAAKASVGFATRLRKALFERVQSLSYAQLDGVGVDTLITRMTSDLNQVQNGVNLALRLLLRSPFIVFGAMVMAFTIDAREALIFAVAIPVLAAVVFGIMLACIPLYARSQKLLDRLTGLTRENLTGARVIRAFCKEEAAVEEFDAQNEALTKMNAFVGRLSALMNPLTYLLVNLATIWLIASGAARVNSGALLQGDMVALYNYMAQIIVELIKLASLIISINRALACMRRIAQTLDIEPDMAYASDAPQAKGDEAVRFENVSFRYGEAAEAVKNVSFALKTGQTLGVIGGTGSGKTTLASLIARFYDPSEGRVLLFGHDAKAYSREALTGLIGVVPQKSQLFEGTIRDNLRWGNENADDETLWRAIDMAQARDVVQRKEGGLDAQIEQGGRNLSGGQRQRLCIARALAGDPRLLILDDSASALDYATDLKLRRALRSLSGRTTTVIVSQRCSSVRRADLILVLDDGVLAGQGTHDELMASCDAYREIYYSQYPDERPAATGREALA